REMEAMLPTGTVTFLFTDIEGSAQLWQAHPDVMPAALARHHAILRDAIESHRGHVFQIIGDAFCAAFATAPPALAAALAAQRGLRVGAELARAHEEQLSSGQPQGLPLRVRMGLHTGEAEWHGSEYDGYLTLTRAQRIMSAGHGGQVLLSQATYDLARHR